MGDMGQEVLKRVLDGLERRYERLLRAHHRAPNQVTHARVEVVRLALNAAIDECGKARRSAR